MPYIFLFVGLLILIYLMVRSFVSADPKAMANTIRRFGGFFLLLLAVFLSARGGFLVGIPLAIYALTLFGRSFGWSLPKTGWRRPGNANKSQGQKSEVRTPYLQMILDHDTGAMEGVVLKGLFEGSELSRLSDNDLIKLLVQVREKDSQSGQLVEAFLDVERPGWRKSFKQEAQNPFNWAGAGGDGPMTIDQAFEILGLEPGATTKDVNRAHRALMKKFHPDQGGSTYLAAQINQAKEILISHLS